MIIFPQELTSYNNTITEHTSETRSVMALMMYCHKTCEIIIEQKFYFFLLLSFSLRIVPIILSDLVSLPSELRNDPGGKP